jgi:hypothetical protein
MVLVGVVAALGLSIPTPSQCEQWWVGLRSVGSATLADWDQWKPRDKENARDVLRLMPPVEHTKPQADAIRPVDHNSVAPADGVALREPAVRATSAERAVPNLVATVVGTPSSALGNLPENVFAPEPAAWLKAMWRRPHASPKRDRGKPNSSLAVRASINSSVLDHKVTNKAPTLNHAEPAPTETAAGDVNLYPGVSYELDAIAAGTASGNTAPAMNQTHAPPLEHPNHGPAIFAGKHVAGPKHQTPGAASDGSRPAAVSLEAARAAADHPARAATVERARATSPVDGECVPIARVDSLDSVLWTQVVRAAERVGTTAPASSNLNAVPRATAPVVKTTPSTDLGHAIRLTKDAFSAWLNLIVRAAPLKVSKR